MHITTLCLLQRCLCLSLFEELVLPPEASQRLFFVTYIEDLSFQSIGVFCIIFCLSDVFASFLPFFDNFFCFTEKISNFFVFLLFSRIFIHYRQFILFYFTLSISWIALLLPLDPSRSALVSKRNFGMTCYSSIFPVVLSAL